MVILADPVLSNLLEFVGKGYHLYAGGVSRQWRSLYGNIAKDEYGILRTKYSAATASIAALKWARACGLDLVENSLDLGSSDFGPGVYEWAKGKGLPLVVWVAIELRYSSWRTKGTILGVYSTIETAKQTAIDKACTTYGLDPDAVATLPGEKSRKEWEIHLEERASLKVEGFPVMDAPENVQRYKGYGWREYGEPFEIQGVYSTKAGANRAIDEFVAVARDDARMYAPDDASDEEDDDVVRVYVKDGWKGFEEGSTHDTSLEWGRKLDAPWRAW